MERIRIWLAHREAEADAADAVARALGEAVRELPPGLALVLEPVALAAVPALEGLGPADVVLGFLPAGELDPDEVGRLAAYGEAERARLVPVSTAPERDVPPAPLGAIVSFRLHGGGDRAAVLARHVLALAALRLPERRRKVFVSYTVRDGTAAAARLVERLAERGFDAWRDVETDADGVERIRPGDPAQRTIEEAVREQACVLLVDTPEANGRAWVHEEVNVALRELLPIVPVVFFDAGGRRPPVGGRFRSLRELQLEVAVPCAGLESADAALDDAVMEAIEGALATAILANLRTRWRIVPRTQELFERARYAWTDLERRLLFHAVGPDPRSPFVIRPNLLVQCSPYERVVARLVQNLAEERDGGSVEAVHLAVLVHNDDELGEPDAQGLVAGDERLCVLTPDAIEAELLGGAP